MSQTTLTVNSILDGSGTELVQAADGQPVVPLTLTRRAWATPNRELFRGEQDDMRLRASLKVRNDRVPLLWPIQGSHRSPLFEQRGPSICGGSLYPALVAPGQDIFTAGLTGGVNPGATAYTAGPPRE